MNGNFMQVPIHLWESKDWNTKKNPPTSLGQKFFPSLRSFTTHLTKINDVRDINIDI